jgi:hypothetical protein
MKALCGFDNRKIQFSLLPTLYENGKVEGDGVRMLLYEFFSSAPHENRKEVNKFDCSQLRAIVNENILEMPTMCDLPLDGLNEISFLHKFAGMEVKFMA